MAIERAPYTVVTSRPPYEIRDYSVTTVATVTVEGSRGEAVSAGFRLLASYIFGNNQQKSKIAMTAPVSQLPQTSLPSATSKWVVSFMMPAGYTRQNLPPPADSRVHFQQIPPHRVAAIRFSGFWSDNNLKSHEADLVHWMQTQHLAARSAPTYAYYDPPWKPWFLRTIEVLIDIE